MYLYSFRVESREYRIILTILNNQLLHELTNPYHWLQFLYHLYRLIFIMRSKQRILDITCSKYSCISLVKVHKCLT